MPSWILLISWATRYLHEKGSGDMGGDVGMATDRDFDRFCSHFNWPQVQ